MSDGAAATLCDAAQGRLVVVDIQERLAGVMAAADRERVIERTGILLQAAARLGVPVVATEQYPKGLGPTEPAVAGHLPAAAAVVDKTCFACGGADGFRQALAVDEPGAPHRPQLVLTGMEAHVCVLQTALEMHAEGYQVFVVADAVCSRRAEHYDNALARLRQAGVIVTNTESVAFEWLRDAKHPDFKAVSALVK